MENDKIEQEIIVCPKCGKTAWTRRIEGTLYFYCPYCGGHGKVPTHEPVGDPTPEDDEHLHE